MIKRGNLKPHHKWYTLADGRMFGSHERSCFFCKHCTDIFYDYTHGPYMFYCELGLDGIDEPNYIELAFQGKCPKWDGGEMNND